MKNTIYLLLIITILFSSCSKDEGGYISIEENPLADLNLPESYFNYANIQLPSYYIANEFPTQFQFQDIIDLDNTPSNNQITDAGATLGRVLFYDKKLSANGTVSCASCHQAENGFLIQMY